MLTFAKLGHKGNLGNQLFQIASTIGLSKKYGHDFTFPKWSYSDYFDFDFHESELKYDWESLNESRFNFYDWNIPNVGNYSINGWLQSELYFNSIDVHAVFKFKKDFEKKILEKYQELFSKPSILITVRRGDFVDNDCYFQLSYKYYFSALLHFFPDFENYNIVFTSDDINYCKYHFSFLNNVHFLEGLNAIEQLCLASYFDHFIISNSTFSWWLAKLGEKEKSLIVRPIQNFDGSYSEKYNEKDYFPIRWYKHDEKKVKIPLQYYKLILRGEVFKFNHQMKNFLKKRWIKKKKCIKKLIGRK